MVCGLVAISMLKFQLSVIVLWPCEVVYGENIGYPGKNRKYTSKN